MPIATDETPTRRYRSRMERRLFYPAVGLLLVTACGSGGVEPRVVEGLADANDDGTLIALRDDPSDNSGEGYIVVGADFRQGNGPTREGGLSTCIKPGATGQRVRLGVVRVDGTDDFPIGREHVVWVQCLDE
jgi:hypothetical protein